MAGRRSATFSHALRQACRSINIRNMRDILVKSEPASSTGTRPFETWPLARIPALPAEEHRRRWPEGARLIADHPAYRAERVLSAAELATLGADLQ